MKKIYTFAAISALCLSGCVVDEVNSPAPGLDTIQATIQTEESDTKVGLASNGTTVVWSADDQISVFASDGSNHTNHQYTLTAESAGNPTGTFTGNATGTKSVAFYPYAAGHSYDGTAMSVAMPASYDFDAAGISKAPMASNNAAAEPIPFKNAGALMAITVENIPEGYKTATLTSADNAICGNCTVTFDEDGNPSLVAANDATGKVITINAAEDASSRTFHFPLPVGKYSALQFALSNGTSTIVLKTKALDAKRSVKYRTTVNADGFAVIFRDADGVLSSTYVAKGGTVAKPANPKKGTLTMGLYEGNIDPDGGAYIFGGWYTDSELTTEYDFATAVDADLTLYAKWTAPVKVEFDDAGAFDYAPFKQAIEKLNTIYTDEIKGKEYTLVVTGDRETGNSTMTASVKLYVKGQQELRTLTLRWGKTELKNKAEIYIGKNVKFTIRDNSEVFRLSDNSKMYLLEGGQIADCHITNQLGVIYMNGSADAYFYLQGGMIINNTVTSRTDSFNRCAVICADNGRVRIESGEISGNTVTATVANRIIAGAILTHSANWNQDSIRQTGGVIENNTAVCADGATAKMGQQVLAQKNDGSEVFVINESVTNCNTHNWGTDWSSPWIKLAE